MTAVASAPPVVASVARSRSAARVVHSAPDLIACAAAGFAVPAVVLLLAGHFSPGWVLPLGIAGATAAAVACGRGAERVDPRAVRYTLAAIGVVVAWLVVNSVFSAENMYAYRDPATYNLAGRWLMDHSSLHIPTHPEVFGSPAGYNDTSAGFRNDSPGQVYAQGNHLLPALLAVAGWLFGTSGMLVANVAFGALALLVLFGLARRVVGAPLALLAMTALAVSMPIVFVSRDTYSEPLALLFLMGGLLMLHRAVESGRVRDFALAGLVAGCTAPVRIDSYPSLLAILIAAIVLLALAAPGSRRHLSACIGALLAGAAGPTVLGWLDVSRLASGYYRDERHHIMPAIELGAGLLVALPIVVAVAWRPAVRRRLVSRVLWHRLTLIAGCLIAAAFVFLVSRPFWMVAHGKGLPLVAQLQSRLGETVDPTRSYNEQSVHWLAMYLGWPTVVLGAAGYFLLLRRMVRTRSLAAVGVLTMGLIMSTLYLMSSQITPDQPWAMRRYVPVVMPVLLVAACYSLCVLYRQASAWMRGAAVVGGLAMMAIPVIVTAPMTGMREEVPQRALVDRVCTQLGPRGAVVEVDAKMRAEWGQTMRSYCGVPSIGLKASTSTQLAAVQRSVDAHGRTLYVLGSDVRTVSWAPGARPPMPFAEVVMSRWPGTLNELPRNAAHETVKVYLAKVRPDGLAEPVTPRG